MKTLTPRTSSKAALARGRLAVWTRRVLVSLAGFAAVGFILPAVGHAASKFWIGSGGSFSDDANWSTMPGGANNTTAPGASDVAVFHMMGSGNCSIDADISVAGINLDSGYGGAVTQQSGVAITIGSSGFVHESGTFTGGDSAIDLNGSLSLSGGTFQSTSGEFRISGDFDVSGTVNFQHNSGTVVFDGGSAAEVSNSMGGLTFNNMTIEKSDGIALTVSIFSEMYTLAVQGTLVLTDGKINSGSVQAQGDLTHGDDFDGGTGGLTIAGTATRTINISTGKLPNSFTLNAKNATVNGPSSGQLTWGGSFTVTTGTFVGGDGAFQISGAYSQTSGAFSVGAGTAVFAGSMSLSGGVMTMGSVAATFSGSSFGVSGGTFRAGNGSLTINPAVSLQGGTFDGDGAAIDLNGALSLQMGAFKGSTGTITLAGSWTNAQGWASFNPRSGTIVFDGGAATVKESATFHNVTVNKSNGVALSIDTGTDPPFTGTLVSTGTVTLSDGKIAGGPLVSQGGLTNGADFDGGTGTLQITGSGARTISLTGGAAFPNTVLDAANATVNGPSSGHLTFGGTLTLSAGTFAGGDGSVSTSGNYSQDGGLFTVGGGSVTFGGTSASLTAGTFTGGPGRVVVSPGFTQSGGAFTLAGGTATFSGALNVSGGTFTAGSGTTTVAGNFTLSNGTFDGNAATLDFGGNMTLSGGTLTLSTGTTYVAGDWDESEGAVTFDHNSGTVVFDGSTAKTMTVDTSRTFHHVILQKGDGIAFDVADRAGGGATLISQGTLTLADGKINTGTLRAEGGLVHGDAFDGGTGALLIAGDAARTINLSSAGRVPAAFTLNAENTTVNGPSSGIMTFDGAFTLTAGTFAGGAGAVRVSGAYSQTDGSFSVGAGSATFASTLTLSSGTFTGGAAEIGVTGNFTQSSGTFTLAGGTMTAGGTVTITSGTFTAGTGPLNVGGAFDIQGGVFDGNAATVNFDSNVTLTAGGFLASTGTVSVAGNWTHTASGAWFQHSSGTISFDGNADGTISLDTYKVFYDVSFDRGNSTTTIANNVADSAPGRLIVLGTLSLNSGWVNNGILEVLNGFSHGSGFEGGTGTLTFAESDSQSLGWTLEGLSGSSTRALALTSGGELPKVVLNGSGTTLSGPGSGTVAFDDTFTIQGGTMTATDGTVVVAGAFSMTGGAFIGQAANLDFDGSFTLTTGTFTASTATFSIAGNFFSDVTVNEETQEQFSGTFNASSATVVLDGDASSTFNVNSSATLFNFTINKPAIVTFGDSDNIVVTSTLTLTDGTINNNDDSLPAGIEARGGMTLGPDFDGGGTPVSITGTTTRTIDFTQGGTLPALTLNARAVALEAAVTGELTFSDSFTVQAGTFTVYGGTAVVTGAFSQSGGLFSAAPSGGRLDFNGSISLTGGTFFASTGTLSAAGDWTQTTGAAFHHSSGTILIDGGDAVADLAGLSTFYALTVNKDAGTTLTIGAGDSFLVLDDVSFLSGAVSGGAYEVQGDVAVGTGYEGGTGALSLTGSADQTFDLTGAESLYDGNITVNKPAGSASLASALTLDAAGQTLTVTSGTFYTGGFDLAVSGTSGSRGVLTVQSGGDFQLNGDETIFIQGGARYFDRQAGSTVTYVGSGIYPTLQAANTYYNLAFTNASGRWGLNRSTLVEGVITLAAGSLTTGGGLNFPLTVSTMSIQGGTFLANSSTITVTGHWLFSSGSFDAGSSTFTFQGAAGSTHTLTGSSTFYALRGLTGNIGFNLQAGSTITVTDRLTLTGASGNPITLRPSSDGSPWFLKNSGANSVSYVNVKDSDARAGNRIDPSNSTDSGNNFNWDFGDRHHVWLGGKDTNWSDATNWSNGVPTSGDAAIIVSTAAYMPTLTANVAISTLTINAGAALTLGGYNLTVSSITNAGILSMIGTETVSSAPAGIAGSTITLTNTSGASNTLVRSTWTYRNLHINGAGGTFVPAGALVVQDALSVSAGTFDTTSSNYAVTASTVILRGGTLTLNNSTATVSGDWRYNSGTFNAGSSTVTFSAADSRTLDSAGKSFGHLVFNGAGGTWTLGSQLTAAGSLKVSAGTLTTSAGSYYVSVGTDVVINGGTFTLNASTAEVAGNWIFSSGTFNANTSTVTFTGAAGSTSTFTGSATFNALRCVTAGKGLNFPTGSTQTVSGMLTLTGSGSNPVALRSSADGSPWFLNNSGGNSISVVSVRDSDARAGSRINAASSSDFGNNRNWDFGNSHAWTGALNTDWSNVSNWEGGVPGSEDAAIIVSTAANMPTLTAHVTISTLTINAGATLTLNGYNLSVTSFTNTGDFRFKGTEQVSAAPSGVTGSSVTYNSTSGSVAILSTWTYRNLHVNGAGGTFNVPSGSLVVNEALTLTAGTLDTTASNYAVTASSVVFRGGTFNANGSTITVTGDWRMFSGTFDADSSTVTFTGVSGSTSTLVGSTTFYAFRCATANKGFTLPAGSTQTVTDRLTLAGSSGNLIRLRSSSSGTYAFLANTGANNVSFADVRDNNASGGNAIAAGADSVNSGNTVNWTYDLTAPNAVTDFAADTPSLAAQIHLSWTAPGDDGGSGAINSSTFTIQYSTVSTVAFSTTTTPAYATNLNIATTSVSAGSAQSYFVSGLTEGATYYFRLWTLDDSGNTSSLSNGATAWAQLTPPPLGLGLSFPDTTTYDKLKLDWVNTDTGELSTRVERSTDGSSFVFVTSVTAPTATYTHTGLLPNTSTWYRIRSVFAGNVLSDYSATVNKATRASAPVAGSITLSVSSATVAWTDPVGNPADTVYSLVRSTGPDFGGTLSTATTTGLSATFTSLTPNTTYSFEIAAANREGVYTSFSVAGTSVTLANPPSGSGTFTVNASSATVAWGADSNSASTRYDLQASTRSDFNPVHVTSTVVTNEATLTGLIPNASYYFRVWATNHAGVGTSTTSLTDQITKAATPSGLALSLHVTSGTVSWSANSNPSDTVYTLRVSPSAGFSVVTTSAVTTSTSASVTGLSVNQTYFFAVYGTGRNGSDTAQVSASSTTLPYTPGTPTVTGSHSAANGYFTTITIDANGSTADTQYAIYYTSSVSSPIDTQAAGYLNSNGGTSSEPTWLTLTGSPGWNTNATHTGLVAGGTYYYQVTARNRENAQTRSSPPGSGRVPALETPTSLAVSTRATTSITWAWTDNSTGEINFKIREADGDLLDTTPSTEQSTPNLTGSTYTWQQTGLVANTPYSLRVHANHVSSGEGLAAAATTYTLAHAPSVTASASTATINVVSTFTFTNVLPFGVDGVTKYRYAWNTMSVDSDTGTWTGSWTSGQITLSALANLTTHYLHVASFNGDDAFSGIRDYGPYYYVEASAVSVSTIAVTGTATDSQGVLVGVETSARPLIRFTGPVASASLSSSTVKIEAIRDNLDADLSSAQAPATVLSYDSTLFTLTLNPFLTKGYTYRITVTTGVTNAVGAPLSKQSTLDFRTLMDKTVENKLVIRAPTPSGTGAALQSVEMTIPADSLPQDGAIQVSLDPQKSPLLVSPVTIQTANERARSHSAYDIPLSMSEFAYYNSTGVVASPVFSKAITLSFRMTGINDNGIVREVAAPIRTRTLNIRWLDPQTGTWVRISGTTIDTDNQIVSVPIYHFSVYSVFGAPDTDVSESYAFPVPFKPSEGHSQITFTNLPSEATIKVFTISGELVKQINHSDSSGSTGKETWDVRNDGGDAVASDVYYYVVTSSGQKKKGKILVVR